MDLVASSDEVVKCGVRDLAVVAARGGHGATTVASTAWLAARAGGLPSEAAAAAVGVPLSTLKRWRNDPQSKSRRPLRTRRPTHPPGLAAAVERLRLDHPMWGKAKLTPILRSQGFEVSEARVGRVLSELMARGLVPRVPDLIRNIAA